MAVDPKTIFEAISKSPMELLADRGLGLYIPSYQRPYSWDKDKVSRLIEDISHGIKTLIKSDESFTFLGTVITIHDVNNSTVQPIVRTDVPSKVLTVIDGQQRMTTLLLVCIALHNTIHLTHKQFIKKTKVIFSQHEKLAQNNEEITPELESNFTALEWLDGQTKEVLSALADTFYEKYSFGKSPLYPRMIRSIDDQWSKNTAYRKYDSPIAHLTFNYITEIDKAEYEATEYKPVKRNVNMEGEEAIVDRFNQITKILKTIISNRSSIADEMDEIPNIEDIYSSESFQEGLLNHVGPISEIRALPETEKEIFDKLSLLVFYARYVLHRVVLTVVKGKNEDYAFTIFESLNTTGEPLTAFETFKPRVVNAVGLAEYESSVEKQLLDQVSDYLCTFSVGPELQKATKELLIHFFSSYSGMKISGRLAEQRSALKTSFEETTSPIAFIKMLSYCANFKKFIWESDSYTGLDKFFGIHQLSTTSKLGLKFFKDINHTIVIPILTLFFSQIVDAPDATEKEQRFKEFEEALQAMVAFSTLWRATRRGTGGIDNEYREFLSKTEMPSGLPRLARLYMKDNIINIDQFKAELKSRLLDSNRKGKVINKENFINLAINQPIYKNAQKVAKFILLVAHHDAIADSAYEGLLTKGKDLSNPCLNIESYVDDRSLSLEHIAPQSNNGSWEATIYENGELIDTLGNLVLVSKQLNSSLGNRIWAEKRVFYKVVGAQDQTSANQILSEAAEKNNIRFGELTQELLQAQKYMPNLIALGNMNKPWTSDFIITRSRRLYELAWDELINWLE
ncbi:DUF262 domain-containing HNH endonuclease family protein [Acinetobacter sp. ME22]|uniref:DUF262 domain-containing HNH endonuclease family protein n=1 Tax=Acinetobacter sp. ME22 TaxID=2904802 RepID=UPI001ED9DB33|nr:DUF262 domain-containing HNH endonuclease family protein [Acinetobacter sp. ME22]MCG2573457.1 DUF262 domain-containing HNH endonuclease family protein [Acinetobacter sp. ME22]